MGRKAKLKKVRQQTSSSAAESSSQSQPGYEPTKFVQQLEQKGYQLQTIIHAPQIPDSRVDPQL